MPNDLSEPLAATGNSAASAVRVACDVGGTFTDICIVNEVSGRMHVAKVATTPDPIEGVLQGISAGGVDLKDVALFSHGTTLATNALITRKFPPAAVRATTCGTRTRKWRGLISAVAIA